MKKILIALFLTIGTFASHAQEVKWLTLDEALALQKVTQNQYLWMFIPIGVVRAKCWIKIPFTKKHL